MASMWGALGITNTGDRPEVFIGAKVSLKATDLKDGFISALDNYYSCDNPEYVRRVRLGLWTGNTSPKICMVERKGDWLNIPYGFRWLAEGENRDCFSQLNYYFLRYKKTYDYGSNIKLYDYQQKALDSALASHEKYPYGVIVAPCGSGKTQIGLELAASLGGKTLWLTHTKDLLNQSMVRAKAAFEGLSEKDFGTITDGKVDIGSVITFATVQTMAKLDLSDYINYWDVAIVDECHHICGGPTKLQQFWKVISSLNVPCKFGLTATPKRSDGLTKCMFALLGPKVAEITAEEIAEKRCPVRVRFYGTAYYPKDVLKVTNPDGTFNYTNYISDLCEDQERNEKIIDCVWDIVASGENCLILTDRQAHAITLSSMLDEIGINRHCVILGKTSGKIRDGLLESMKTGKNDVMISTFQLAKEGLDIPNLRNVLFATPQKNETTIIQAAGRVARTYPGKDHGTVWDCNDFSAPLFSDWPKRRLSIYNRNNFLV